MAIKSKRAEENSSCGGFWNSLDVGTKISRICYAGETNQNIDVYLSGTWEEETNKLTLWQIYYGRAVATPDSYYKRCSELTVNSSVNSIYCEKQYIIAGLESGSVEVCVVENGEHLKKLHSLPKVHGKFAGSTSVCIVDGEIISGSDDGSIVRVDLSTLPNRPTTLSTDLNAVKCMTVLGAHEFVSAHGSGQIHLWDVRQINPAITIGNSPLFSKAVSSLTDSITSIDSHPAQPNVVVYGTNSGSTAFIDVRQYKQPTPNLLKVSQEPITDVRFHPNFPTNCFVLSAEGLLQLDLSMAKAENRDPEIIEENAGNSMGVLQSHKALVGASLSTFLWTRGVQYINQLGNEYTPKQLSSFDISPHSILCGSNTNCLSLLTNAQFF